MFNLTKGSAPETVIDVANLVLGVLLVLAPWGLGFTSQLAASQNAWVVGPVIGLVALGALVSFAEWQEWVNGLLGIWLVAAPWILRFSSTSSATFAHVVIGIVVTVLAASDLWSLHHRSATTA
jgi:hypothetical protein